MKSVILCNVIIAALVLTMAGCYSENHDDVGYENPGAHIYEPETVKWAGLFGLVGVPFQNGVECLASSKGISK